MCIKRKGKHLLIICINVEALIHTSWQGLSEQAMNTFRIMRADGIKPSIVVLNSLINAFGEDRRDTEAFAVLHFMKENVSFSLYLSMLLDILETAIKHL